jgi:hypothetical protein
MRRWISYSTSMSEPLTSKSSGKVPMYWYDMASSNYCTVKLNLYWTFPETISNQLAQGLIPLQTIALGWSFVNFL